jgi:hypothetical protein
MTRATLCLLTLAVLACTEDTTSPDSNTNPVTPTSGMGPAPEIAPANLIDCSNAYAPGNVIRVNSNPQTGTAEWSELETQLIGSVYRDDPRTPGIQLYCEDHSINVSWNHDLTRWYLAPVNNQSYLAQPYGGTYMIGKTYRFIAVAGTNGVVYAPRDTTWLTVVNNR